MSARITSVVTCGGGIVRDLCLGTLPPAGLTNWRYLAVSLLAAAWVVWADPAANRLRSPVQLFDAIGLGLFAVAGAKKVVAVRAGVGAEVELSQLVAGSAWTPWFAATVCIVLRLTSLRFGWRLPVI
ncbi:TRIC cation channel family protein [Pseudomonas sp.]|uniref:trimeric intracellular cation channel family protein n=1 Tax=Pseudomonas sp. TaxID=306 RepID=UPI0025EFD53B|nr:TRIC cation channel family protein [Pseudomonas sp.]